MLKSSLKCLLVFLSVVFIDIGCSDGSQSTSTAHFSTSGDVADSSKTDTSNTTPPTGSDSDVTSVPRTDTETQTPNDTKTQSNLPLNEQMLEQFAGNLRQVYQDFETASVALETSIKAYQGSLGAEDRAKAQTAWKAAMDLWQHAEVMQVGPAGVMGEVVGGDDWRDEVYSWPLVNNCRVDQETVTATYEDQAAFEKLAVNTRGLDALEYLLFQDGDGNACKSTASINKKGKWEAIQGEVKKRRAAYAVATAALVTAKAKALAEAWGTAETTFAQQFTTAGKGSDSFSNVQQALNAVSDALFYVDKVTKDMKLAEPAGLSECDEDVCPDARESRWANYSKEHIVNNLKAAQLVFLGAVPGEEGVGLDDLLNEIGAGDLAAKITASLEKAISSVEAIDGTILNAVTKAPQSVVDAHAGAKGFTDLLKTELMSVLNLEVPQRAASDND